MKFYERHVCRVVPFPAEVMETFEQIQRNPTVYNTMNGPNEFYVIGTLKNWSVIDKVKAINVPTLLISGRYDEATPAVVQPFADNIKGARWMIFENSSHMPHVEEKAKCMSIVGAFLDAND
jgi:L-proline amide hydrolase